MIAVVSLLIITVILLALILWAVWWTQFGAAHASPRRFPPPWSMGSVARNRIRPLALFARTATAPSPSPSTSPFKAPVWGTRGLFYFGKALPRGAMSANSRRTTDRFLVIWIFSVLISSNHRNNHCTCVVCAVGEFCTQWVSTRPKVMRPMLLNVSAWLRMPPTSTQSWRFSKWHELGSCWPIEL